MTVMEVDRLVRATTHPYPGAFTFVKGDKVIIWSGRPEVATGQTGLAITCIDGVYFALDHEFANVSRGAERL